MNDSQSSTVVDPITNNDANLNTFYEMHLTDTRDSVAQRTLSQHQSGWSSLPTLHWS
jgi:uncharacterized protein YecT (DUF1311 family)